MRLLFSAGIFGSVDLWAAYLDHAYPVVKPTDWEQQIAAMRANLTEPGRMNALQAMGRSAPKDAGACLADVHCPALIVAGSPHVQYPEQVADLLLPFLKQSAEA